MMNEVPEFEQALWDIVNESKHDSRIGIAAVNAISILAAGNKIFAKKDLRGIRIRGANLAGVNFAGTNFRGADLRDINFSHAWLNAADLSSSCLDNMQTGELFEDKFTSEVMSCAFSANDEYYLVLCSTNISIYKSQTHQQVSTVSLKLAENESLTKLAVSSQDNTALVGTSFGNLIYINILEGTVLHHWQAHKTAAKAIALSSDGKFALSSEDRVISQWNPINGKCLANWQGHTDIINALIIHADGQLALSAGNDRVIKRWDIASGTCLGSWQGHMGSVQTLNLSADGSVALSASTDNTIKIWDVRHNKCEATLQGQYKDVIASAISGDGRLAVTSYQSGLIVRWDVQNATVMTCSTEHRLPVSGLALSADGVLVLSGGQDKILKRWQVPSGRCRILREGHPEKIVALTLTADSHLALSAGYDESSVLQWDLVKGNTKGWSAHIERVTHLVISALFLSPDCSSALSGDITGEIRRWDVWSGTCLQTWQGTSYAVTTLAQYPSSRFAFSGHQNGMIQYWDIASSKIEENRLDHNGAVNDLAIKSDNQFMLSAGSDGQVILWQIPSVIILKKFSLLGPVTVVKWHSSMTNTFILGMSDGSLSIWTYFEDNETLQLCWRSKPWDFMATDCRLMNVSGLTHSLEKLLVNKGARLQNEIKSPSAIMADHEQVVQYQNAIPRQSLVDNTLHVTPQQSVVSFVQRKSNGKPQPAFIILESIEKNVYRIKRIDLVLELRHKAVHEFMRSFVEIQDKSVKDLEILIKDTQSRSVEITHEQGLMLLKNIV